MKKARLQESTILFIFIVIIAACFSTNPLFLLSFAQTATTTYSNDPLLAEQWGWFRVDADDAWLTGYEGSGVIVAVFDTGIDLDHPDLKDVEIVYAWNYVEDSSNVTDVDGHGTLVAGVIAATTNNQIGIAGIAAKTKLAIFKVLEESGGSWMDLARAVREARGVGADVYVMSLGGTVGGRAGSLVERELELAYDSGGVIVAAAGNDGTDVPTYPAAYDNVIGVGALEKNDTRASWSNYGSNVELMAPGVSIASAYLDGRYAYASGTSFAAPHVAGVVALLLGKEPSLTPDGVRERLRSTAVNLGDSYYYGYGLVDAQAALGVEVPELPVPTPQPEEPTPPIDEESVVEPPQEPAQVQPPLILDIITVPESPAVGVQVEFEAVVEVQNGSITSWLWAFGDNSTSTDQHPYHTYQSSGEYDVEIVVTDSNGLSAHETGVIIVQDQEILKPAQPIPIAIAVLVIVVAVVIASIVLTAAFKRTQQAQTSHV